MKPVEGHHAARRWWPILTAGLALGVITSPPLAAASWTLWSGTTTFTDVNARLLGEVQIAVQTGLDRAGCETLKQNKLAELRPSALRGAVDDAFVRLERGSEATTKVLMRYLCVRSDARPGPAPGTPRNG